MDIRTVQVEILREGPRHNQLLSPLTNYLAVCGDAQAARLVLPGNYQHDSFERRMQELRYEVVSDDPGRLRGVLDETGADIAGILQEIPGFAGAVSPKGHDEFVHVRLMLGASELSRLPFELSKVPAGAGAPPDGWLLLNGNVCLTRRNRAVRASHRPWGTAPTVLFVAGPDVEDPFIEHLAVFRRLFAPWTACPEQRGPKSGSAPWLTVLQDATLTEVERAMRQRPTFVHILAHGDDDVDDAYGRFGVRLADGTVSGRRLASALSVIDDADTFLPSVVSLASCDSANEASPIPPDVNVAYALHSTGIPLVVASQFPISAQGSTPFVEVMYGDLLHGGHPLRALQRVRQALHTAQGASHHDWAAITAHEALPSDLDEQLTETRYWQSRRAHEAALRRVEAFCAKHRQDVDADTSRFSTRYEELVAAVKATADRLPSSGPYLVEATGLRAAGCKRLAEVDFWLENYENSANLIRQSLDEYRSAVDALLGSGGETVNKKVSLHWMLTQVLSTSLLVTDERETGDAGRFTSRERSLWETSKLSAEIDRDGRGGENRAWGHVSLTELWLLRLSDASLTDPERHVAEAATLENAQQIVRIMKKQSEQARNTARQIRRYLDWWGTEQFAQQMPLFGIGSGAVWSTNQALRKTARQVIEILGDPGAEPHPDPDQCDEGRSVPKGS